MNYKELRSIDLEDLMQSLTNSIYKLEQKINKGETLDEYHTEEYRRKKNMLEDVKAEYSSRGMNSEEYVNVIISNIVNREKDDDIER